MTGSKWVPNTLSMPSELYLVRAKRMELRSMVRGSCLVEVLTEKMWLEVFTRHRKLSLARTGHISSGRRISNSEQWGVDSGGF